MRNKGMTMIEVAITLAVIAILVALTAPTFLSEWKKEGDIKTATRGLLDDLKWAQAEAQKQGSMELLGGLLRRRRIFVVFDGYNNSYNIWRWQDEDGDNIPKGGELSPDFNNPNNDAAVKTEQLDGVSFGSDSSVDDTACANSGTGAPGNPFSTSISTPSYPPCNSSPCIQFDAKGFMKGQPNKVIYITDNKYSYAIAGNLAGIFKMCKWVDDHWQITRG